MPVLTDGYDVGSDEARFGSKRAHTRLLGEVVAASRKVGETAPRLNAKVGGGVLVPKNEVVKAVEVNPYLSVADLALESYAVALYILENNRVEGEVSVIEDEFFAVVYHKLRVIGENVAVKTVCVEGLLFGEDKLVSLDSLGAGVSLVSAEGAVHSLIVKVFRIVGHLEACTVKLVFYAEGEGEGVHLAGFLVIAENEGDGGIALRFNLKVGDLREAVLGHLIALAVKLVSAFFETAAHREHNRCRGCPERRVL